MACALTIVLRCSCREDTDYKDLTEKVTLKEGETYEIFTNGLAISLTHLLRQVSLASGMCLSWYYARNCEACSWCVIE